MGKEKKPSFGVLFWIALLCFIAVLYIGSRVQFPQWIAQRFGGDYRRGTLWTENPAPKDSSIEKPDRSEKATEGPQGSPVSPKDEGTSVTERLPPSHSITSTTPESQEGATPKSSSPPTRTRISKLYFLRIADNGRPELIAVERQVSFRTAPLTETLKELLKGPSSPEKDRGLSSLIPPGTEIKSVSIQDGIVYLDLGESFRFNPFGAEGYHAQVRQIVYTVTEFPGIQGVQFLVEGRKLDYLSPEGVYIGKPLSRESFTSRTR